MFKFAAIGFALAAIYTEYPAFTKRGFVVEAWTDRGPIVEMIIRCPGGVGIISYSRLENVYCSSKNRCHAQQAQAIAETCG